MWFVVGYSSVRFGGFNLDPVITDSSMQPMSTHSGSSDCNTYWQYAGPSSASCSYQTKICRHANMHACKPLHPSFHGVAEPHSSSVVVPLRNPIDCNDCPHSCHLVMLQEPWSVDSSWARVHLVVMRNGWERAQEHNLFLGRQPHVEQLSCNWMLRSIDKHCSTAVLQVHWHVWHALQQLYQALTSNLQISMLQ